MRRINGAHWAARVRELGVKSCSYGLGDRNCGLGGRIQRSLVEGAQLSEARVRLGEIGSWKGSSDRWSEQLLPSKLQWLKLKLRINRIRKIGPVELGSGRKGRDQMMSQNHFTSLGQRVRCRADKFCYLLTNGVLKLGLYNVVHNLKCNRKADYYHYRQLILSKLEQVICHLTLSCARPFS